MADRRLRLAPRGRVSRRRLCPNGSPWLAHANHASVGIYVAPDADRGWGQATNLASGPGCGGLGHATCMGSGLSAELAACHLLIPFCASQSFRQTSHCVSSVAYLLDLSFFEGSFAMHFGLHSGRVSCSVERSHQQLRTRFRAGASRAIRRDHPRGPVGDWSFKRSLRFENLEQRLNLCTMVFECSSLPSANHTIYLDFTGHATPATGTDWDNAGYGAISSPAFTEDADPTTFTPAEEETIREVFYRVAEDFAPFNVNVTTVEPAAPFDDLMKDTSPSTDTRWGVRVVITSDTMFNCNCSGMALMDSFNSSSDTPAFVFHTYAFGSPTLAKGIAESISHEVGHTLGLSDDGTSSVANYAGHGAGVTSWAPIMGTGYTSNVTQWDRGEYYDSNNASWGPPFSLGANGGKGPDDLEVITTYNGFGYRPDVGGPSASSGEILNVWVSDVSDSGMIETTNDIDYFYFQTGEGMVSLSINPAAFGANLDILAKLYTTNGFSTMFLIAESNDSATLSADINVYLPEGLYLLTVESTGVGDPTVNPPVGYTKYGSLGGYEIEGTVVPHFSNLAGIFGSSATQPEGNSGATGFTFMALRSHPTNLPALVGWQVSGYGTSPASPADFCGGVYPSGKALFETWQHSTTISVCVKGDTVIEANESFRITIVSSTLNDPGGPFGATGTIMDDDTLTFSISATDLSKMEGTGSSYTAFPFKITRSGGLGITASVEYSVAGSGIHPASGSDFATGFPTNQVVQFLPNQSTSIVYLQVVADNTQECNESLKVSLSTPVGGTIGTDSWIELLIKDDDRAKGRVYPKCALGPKSVGGRSDNDEIDEQHDISKGVPARTTAVLRADGTHDFDEEYREEHDEPQNGEATATSEPAWIFVSPGYLPWEQPSVPAITWMDGALSFDGLLPGLKNDRKYERERGGLESFDEPTADFDEWLRASRPGIAVDHAGTFDTRDAAIVEESESRASEPPTNREFDGKPGDDAESDSLIDVALAAWGGV